ncbi:MAG: aldo/keto reductase [Chloroflexota bacterium]
MEFRFLGTTGLHVSRLGLGLAEIGQELADRPEEAERLLNTALDRGINFLDTAAMYGPSEEMIGKYVSARRDWVVLATKAGQATAGYGGEDWTYRTVADSIDRSLRRLRTTNIDLVQLHSCGVDVLKRGEAIRALQDARQAGKARFIGYSGDNEAAEWAVESGLFDTLQTTFNLLDQRAATRLFPRARENKMGIIAKRPIANSAWGAPPDASKPTRRWDDIHPRAQAMQAMGPLPGAPEDRIELALGFTLAHKEVDSAIVGTKSPEHLQSNVRMYERRPPLRRETVHELRRRFEEIGGDWPQIS